MTSVGRLERVAARSLALDSVETLLLKILLHGTGFVATVMISRGLGAEGRGAYSFAVVVAATAVAFCKLGLEQANVYLRGARGVSIERLAGQSGLVAWAIGGLGAGLLLLGPGTWPRLFSDATLLTLLLAGLTVPFTLHANFAAGLLTLDGHVTWQFRVGLVAGLVQVGCLAGLFVWDRLSPDAVLAVNLVMVILTWAPTVRALGPVRPWVRWDLGLLVETLGHSLILHVGMVLFFLQLRLDMFVIKGLVGTAGLGHYSVAVALAETVLLATDSVAIAILPRQIGNTLGDAAAVGLRAARVNLLLGAVVAAGWVVTGAAVVRLFFGEEFAPAYPALAALLPGTVVLGLQRVCGGPVLRAGRPWRMTGIYAISVVCNAALNLWITPRWGIVGAAVASSVSYALSAVLFLAWTASLAGASLPRAVIPGRSDLSLLWGTVLGGVQLLQRVCAAKRTG